MSCSLVLAVCAADVPWLVRLRVRPCGGPASPTLVVIRLVHLGGVEVGLVLSSGVSGGVLRRCLCERAHGFSGRIRPRGRSLYSARTRPVIRT